MSNTFQKEDGQWYFLNETEDDYGPYQTQEEAESAYAQYCKELTA